MVAPTVRAVPRGGMRLVIANAQLVPQWLQVGVWCSLAFEATPSSGKIAARVASQRVGA